MSNLILVDHEDNHIGIEEKLKVHENNLRHRAFSIFIFRINSSFLELLIQKRASAKYHSGNLWSNTCCGHPTLRLSLEECAGQRLKEEMGIDSDLKLIGWFHYQLQVSKHLFENENDHLFIGISKTPNIMPDPKEVQDHKWVNWNEIRKNIKNVRDKFTPWFELAIGSITSKLDNQQIYNIIFQMQNNERNSTYGNTL